jgi:hypothetical protein
VRHPDDRYRSSIVSRGQLNRVMRGMDVGLVVAVEWIGTPASVTVDGPWLRCFRKGQRTSG